MTRCILHVGMHKTGTSSIQQSLNRFANNAFAYADFGGGASNHGGVIFSLVGSTGADRVRARARSAAGRGGAVPRTSAGARAALKQAVRRAGGRTLLLSAEGTLFLSADELRMLRAILNTDIDEIEIVAYIRPPAAYLGSFMQQLIKGGSLTEFSPARAYADYRRSLEKVDAVFGREHVHLWKFDPAAFPEGCVVRDFCRRLGVDLPAARVVHANESLSREGLGLLYTYRRFDRGGRVTGADKKELVEQVAAIGHTRFRLAPDVVRPILEHNRADIDWMEARLGESLAEDIGGAEAGDVREEADLLKPDQQAVASLLRLLADRVPAGVRGETPEEVARLVRALVPNQRGELQMQGRAPRRTDRADALPGLASTLPAGFAPKRAQALLRAVFQHINDELAATREGSVRYSGLGQFRVHTVQQPGAGARTRILFWREGARQDR